MPNNLFGSKGTSAGQGFDSLDIIIRIRLQTSSWGAWKNYPPIRKKPLTSALTPIISNRSQQKPLSLIRRYRDSPWPLNILMYSMHKLRIQRRVYVRVYVQYFRRNILMVLLYLYIHARHCGRRNGRRRLIATTERKTDMTTLGLYGDEYCASGARIREWRLAIWINDAEPSRKCIRACWSLPTIYGRCPATSKSIRPSPRIVYYVITLSIAPAKVSSQSAILPDFSLRVALREAHGFETREVRVTRIIKLINRLLETTRFTSENAKEVGITHSFPLLGSLRFPFSIWNQLITLPPSWTYYQHNNLVF